MSPPLSPPPLCVSRPHVDEEELYDQCVLQMDAGVPRARAIKRAVDAAISIASARPDGGTRATTQVI